MNQALSEFVMNTRTAIRLPCVIITLMAVLLSGCGPSAAEQERMSKIAKVKKIAVVCIVGKSSVSPKAKIHEQFMDDTLAAFQNAAKSTPPVVEFVPIQDVVDNDVYQSVAKIRMPDDAYSPADGLTYIRQGTEEGFDCGPLAEALEVDAVLMVIIDFGVAVRSNGTQFSLTAEVFSRLVGPPEVSLWKGPKSFEENIPATIFSHPKLVGSIGGKWVVMTRPSAAEYAQLMQIAADNDTKVPNRIGASLADDIAKDIKKSREYKATKN